MEEVTVFVGALFCELDVDDILGESEEEDVLLFGERKFNKFALENEEVEIDGIKPFFTDCEDIAEYAFGIELFSLGSFAFDEGKNQKQIAEAFEQCKQLFDACGITEEIRLIGVVID